MRSEKYTPFVNRWLELMEEAWDVLTPTAFSKVEDKILEQIRYSRRQRKVSRG